MAGWKMSVRQDRATDAMRVVRIETGCNPYAEGSALVAFGNTHVICTASVEKRQPPFLRQTNRGWVTGEYGMLPRATHTRGRREAAHGKQSGRTMEIQRLIGRSLRAVVNLDLLGPRTITVDCDVIQADGGTRTAAITGGWVALRIAVNALMADGTLEQDPVIGQVAAVSCGVVEGEALLDLAYVEDSNAEMDANFVMTADGRVVELQATAEDQALPWSQVEALKKLADKGIAELAVLQMAALSA
ncbi:MAG: ribonuclease PH [Mariprofundales bacterium]|nr:ribonuclease PH [Mariprofundales bacterium]